MAWTEALAPTVTKSNIETITSICRTLDGKAATDEALIALAIARWRSGGLRQTRTICESLIASEFSGPKAKSLAKDLLARLDPVTPAGASAGAAVAPPPES